MQLFKVFLSGGETEWELPDDARRVMIETPFMIGYNWEEDGEDCEVLINLENVDGYEVRTDV